MQRLHAIIQFNKRWFLPLLILTCTLRIYTLVTVVLQHQDQLHVSNGLLGLLLDCFTVCFFWGIFSLIEWGFGFLLKRTFGFIVPMLVLLLLFFQMLVDQYYLTMFQPLDAAVYTFSWEELWMIAGLESRLSLGMIVALVLVFTTYFLLVRWFAKRTEAESTKGKKVWLILLGLVIVFAPFMRLGNGDDPEQEGWVNNRLWYFVDDSFGVIWQGKKERKQLFPSDFARLDPDFLPKGSNASSIFPLYHEMDTASVLSPLLKKTNSGKPPRIILLIVESLSADFMGERASETGNLMPFMDSLAAQGIYFPNMLSTSQRTHNVLPAALCAVPNVMDGVAFQQSAYPRHWSLMSLLRKDYVSRFYCGVNLEYLNMRGFMTYHQVPHFPDKWSSQNNRLNKQVNSPWGYPDEAVYRQLEIDRKRMKLDKPTLDVVLTISTHDPFVYPDADKFEQIAKKRIGKIKSSEKKKRLLAQARALGSFCYADEAIRDFFTALKQEPNWEETIVMITGDHGSELYNEDRLARYHVPFLIASPLVKQHRTFRSVQSHLDITPTIVTYLKEVYQLNLPAQVPFMGQQLTCSDKFSSKRTQVFTTNKLRSNEAFMNGYALLGNRVYWVDSLLRPHEVKQTERLRMMKQQCEWYQLFSQYTINQDHIVRVTDHDRWVGEKKWKVVRQQNVFPSKTDLKKQFCQLQQVSTKHWKGKTRIQLLATVYCRTPEDLRQCSDLVISVKPLLWLKRDWVLFKAVRPVFIEKFKANRNNKVVYTIEFDYAVLKDRIPNKQLFINLYNKKQIPQPIYQLETVISEQQ